MFKDSLLKFFKIDGMIGNLTGYIETRMELLKIEIKEDFAKGISKVVVFILMAFVLTLFVFFLSMAVAYKLSEYVGSFGGFAIIAGLYLLVGIIFFLMRESIGHTIENRFWRSRRKRNSLWNYLKQMIR